MITTVVFKLSGKKKLVQLDDDHDIDDLADDVDDHDHGDDHDDDHDHGYDIDDQGPVQVERREKIGFPSLSQSARQPVHP